jgi:serine/threonine protein phosphatase 1
MKILVMGDIHGNLKALTQCLEKSEFNNKKDQLICLGDYVDGWGESAEVIQLLIDLQKESNNRHIFLRGNHDKWCQDWLNKGYSPDLWIQQGGKATINSYINTKLLIEQSHKDFFNNLINYYIDNQNRGFVHGGFTSKKGLGYEPYESNYYWDRDLWSLALIQHSNFHQGNLESIRRFEKHKEIFIGHTSTNNWICKSNYPEWEQMGKKTLPIDIPMNRCNVWNLDTGAGWDGKLTIMDINSKEFWQSDSAKELYPNQKGRI